MSWELTTHEFELNEGYTEVFEAGDPSFTGKVREENSQATLVLVESLSGRKGAIREVIVRSHGADFQSSHADGASAHVLTGFLKRSSGLAVHVTARVKDRFRVSILRLRQAMQKALLPCELCKSVAKILTRALLASAGLSIPGAGSMMDALADLDLEGFLQAARRTPLWQWIVDAKLEVLVFALVGPLFLALRSARSIEDWFYDEVCRAAGYCGDGRGSKLRYA